MSISLSQDIFEAIPSPCFVLEEEKLRRNLERLDSVQRKLSSEFGVNQVLSHKASVLNSDAMFDFAEKRMLSFTPRIPASTKARVTSSSPM